MRQLAKASAMGQTKMAGGSKTAMVGNGVNG